jgi:hypothetical protein
VLEGVNFLFDLCRARHRRLSRLRRMEGTIYSFEQSRAERCLCRCKSPCDRCLIHAKPSSRSSERTCARDGQNVTEIVPIHRLAFLQIVVAQIGVFLQPQSLYFSAR